MDDKYYPEKTNFLNLVNKNIVQINSQGIDIIDRAWAFAYEAHKSQKRDSGNWYFEHPVSVAKLLVEIHSDPTTLAAALLHDVVEDTHIEIDEIQKEFGVDIAFLVSGVTKVSNIEKKLCLDINEQVKIESLIKLLEAITKDYRVSLIKLADRIHNLTTLGAITDHERRKKIADESLNIFSPLASALGFENLKRLIEEYAFPFSNEEAYLNLLVQYEEMEKRYTMMQHTAEREIEKLLQANGYGNALVYGRKKELYSIYKKIMAREDIHSIDDIFDIIGIRIVVPLDSDCKKVSTILDTLGRTIKVYDYIKTPKGAYKYRAIHKVIQLDSSEKIEIQIRSKKMENDAERGPSQHWKYKMNLGVELPPEIKAKLEHIQYTVNALKSKEGALSYQQTLHEINESLQDLVLVYEKGKDHKIWLLEGSTILDLAYHLDTDLGHTCIGANVNNRYFDIRYILKDDDDVELIYNKESTPSINWLTENIVATPEAYDKIVRFFIKHQKQELLKYVEEIIDRHIKMSSGYNVTKEYLINQLKQNYNESNTEELYINLLKVRGGLKRITMIIGEMILQSILNYIGMSLDSYKKIANYFYSISALGNNTTVELFTSVGRGDIDPQLLISGLTKLQNEDKIFINQILESQRIENRNKRIKKSIVEENYRYKVQIGDCCNPLPDDKIVGFLERFDKLTIHREHCSKILQFINTQKDNEIIRHLNWSYFEVLPEKLYKTVLRLQVANLNDDTYKKIQKAIIKRGGVLEGQITDLRSKKNVLSEYPVLITLRIKNTKKLRSLVLDLKRVESILHVERSISQLS